MPNIFGQSNWLREKQQRINNNFRPCPRPQSKRSPMPYAEPQFMMQADSVPRPNGPPIGHMYMEEFISNQNVPLQQEQERLNWNVDQSGPSINAIHEHQSPRDEPIQQINYDEEEENDEANRIQIAQGVTDHYVGSQHTGNEQNLSTKSPARKSLHTARTIEQAHVPY
ncbi:hypothetical protein RDWZM_003763 [Blomia tropicalis]|uniref:Uncharacterized protein n=1 Tax=Blomia tropicalis TaxID=40697 RepID=A0A9Q0RR70_BLOTA|nr:hypothetical protein RDWZM_003763 [Blomia tropicalis]